MRIAIASGKGGTGKTMVATNLAWVAAQQGRRVAYLDCDVEAPNGHLFLHPTLTRHEEISRLIPQVDASRCIRCARCSELCQFSAIVQLGAQVMVFPELCHSCAGCRLVCPAGAIVGVPRMVGCVEQGLAGTMEFVQGRFRVGEASSPTVIRAVKRAPLTADWILLDAPPGASCPMVETVRGADYVLLVTEPTRFGLHDLELAVATVEKLGLRFGVVVNRADERDRRVQAFCQSRRIRVWLEIPDDRRIAEAYARGQLAVEVAPQLAGQMLGLLADIDRECSTQPTASPRAPEPLGNALSV